MRPKKSYGQHFLTSESIADKIAQSLSGEGYDKVLEVGPGKGMLTKYLLQSKGYEITAVDADSDMIDYMEEHYPELAGRLYCFDFLRFDPTKVFGEKQFALIGNYPYNISSQIVFRMLKYREYIPEMIGMFQKEMADRIISGPGSKEYGVISVLTQVYYKCERLFNVERGSFNPPPKVRSAVIRCTRIENSYPELDYSLFRSVVKSAFNNRRKMLRNTMKSFLKGSPLLNDEFFQQRPEQLSVDDFVQLTNQVKEFQKSIK
ncbi:MAG: 16S rRNA (adenine(1518)-N(6)/adenine(1519)-N(6))-dimethyltransferase RsmA [Saprospirales bacterium]|nr:MAG: 16S rRNA (adenine(1518)-N(6)/adenine(1519)-N(6))-dimethyltransferase RsmA [Saprospirales bacterium]